MVCKYTYLLNISEIYILTIILSVFLVLGLIIEYTIHKDFTARKTHHICTIMGGHRDIILLLSMVFIAVIITFKIYWLIKIDYELI